MADYDLNSIQIEDSNVDPFDWSYHSSFREKHEYKLMSKEPLEYFDFKQRYLVKLNSKKQGAVVNRGGIAAGLDVLPAYCV